MEIHFLGGAQTVTGSQHLLSVNGYTILMECGLFQGRRKDTYERNKSFEFDVGVHLKKKWFPNDLVELDVPIISYASIQGHFSDYEAVYELTSTANYFHIWDMYEFGKNYGTTSGFVPTFEIYQ